ncbi:MAG: glycosyltransferase, partial [Fidelibacterota bacterium]
MPHYNGESILTDCLDSLRNSTYTSLEIIIVDNGSTDNSVNIVNKRYPEVICLQQSENLGFAGGCNRGVENATGKYVLILNNDTTHEPDWIE